MRSSKNRSRNKQNNRPRTLGNIINRVFDSSGPEGKVRGTPQQIIEKYQMLARDAQLSNDRVAAENFLQHAEHYTRLLAEAMREMAAEQEARQQSQGNGHSRERGDWRGERDYRPDGEEEPNFPPAADAFAVVDSDEQPIVEFPEARREDRRDDRRDRTQGDRPQGDRPNGERSQGEFRPRNDRPRNERPREERRDNRPPRDDRSRDDRPREAKVIPITEATPQPELPAFITGPMPTSPVDVEPVAPPVVEAAAKPKRAPRKPKEDASAE